MTVYKDWANLSLNEVFAMIESSYELYPDDMQQFIELLEEIIQHSLEFYDFL